MLPREFATDPERLARFAREARLLAALNHPHIAAIYGLQDAPGVRALILELVEGPTLAERLRDGPIPAGEAVAIARQIAEALEAAHDKGIVHRDLKPANIKLTADRGVKVLDFGIAKALDERREDERAESPTLTAAGTWAGMVLGTAAYMSPEQARGQRVDRRTDIWAFGCVLFEMLTGRAPFSGGTPTDTVSAILTREPQWQDLPVATPPDVRRILQRCLEKDPKRRLRDIGDARIELEGPSGTPSTVPPSAGRHARMRASVRGAVVGALLMAIVALAAWVLLKPGAVAPAEPVRASVRLAPGTSVTRGPQFASSVALSPDGRLLAIAGKDAGGQRLYVRSLDRLEPTALAGTDGGSSPFFSPDGAWIGFFAAGRLKRVPANGGATIDIAAAPAPQFPKGASWSSDDRIVFATGEYTGLHVVRVNGGTPEPLTTLDEAAGESSHRDPNILPDGRTLLFAVRGAGGSRIDALDLTSGRRAPIVEGLAPRYAASDAFILSRGTNLLAAALDRSRLALDGHVVPLVEGVATESTGARHFAVSPSGTLAYVPAPRTHGLVLVRGDGTERAVGDDRPSFENP